eukprot:3049700-Pyramimonas_sp.AAC.1
MSSAAGPAADASARMRFRGPPVSAKSPKPASIMRWANVLLFNMTDNSSSFRNLSKHRATTQAVHSSLDSARARRIRQSHAFTASGGGDGGARSRIELLFTVDTGADVAAVRSPWS